MSLLPDIVCVAFDGTDVELVYSIWKISLCMREQEKELRTLINNNLPLIANQLRLPSPRSFRHFMKEYDSENIRSYIRSFNFDGLAERALLENKPRTTKLIRKEVNSFLNRHLLQYKVTSGLSKIVYLLLHQERLSENVVCFLRKYGYVVYGVIGVNINECDRYPRIHFFECLTEEIELREDSRVAALVMNLLTKGSDNYIRVDDELDEKIIARIRSCVTQSRLSSVRDRIKKSYILISI